MENKQARIDLAKRLHHLQYFYTEEYLQELKNKEEEEEEVRKMKESGDPCCMLMTADNNAKVMLDCMKDTSKTIKILKDEDEDVDDWMIAAINAALDSCNEEHTIPFDLPVCMLGMLGANYRAEKYHIY